MRSDYEQEELYREIIKLPDFVEKATMGSTLLDNFELLGCPSASDLAFKMLHTAYPLPVPKLRPVKKVAWYPGHFVGAEYSERGPRKNAKVMFIGKAPPMEVDCFMHPGKKDHYNAFLYNTLKSAGFTDDIMSNVYITNACRFVPAKKNIAAAWLKETNWLLWAEIFMLQPEYIVLMGAEAVKVLLGNKASVEKYRGDFTSISIDLGDELSGSIKLDIPVFVMNNPAATVRDPSSIPDVELDITVFCNRVLGKIKDVKTTDYTIVETPEQMAELESRLLDKQTFAIDCEWKGSSPYKAGSQLLTIQLSWDEGKAALIVVNPQDDGGVDNHCDHTVIRDSLNRILCRRSEDGSPAVSVVGHNFRADFPWLKLFGIDLTEQYLQGFDTMLAHHLLRETGGQGLETCVLEYTNLGRYDIPLSEWVLKNKKEVNVEELGYAKIPREMLYHYALLDADATYRVYVGIQEDLKAIPELYQLFREIVMPASVAITEMEEHGLYVDEERLDYLSQVYSKKRDELLEELRVAINWPTFNFRSTMQVREFLFGVSLNGKLDKEDPTKNIKLSPDGAIILNLTPVKTTDKPPKMWDDIVAEGKEREVSPHTGAESLGILAVENSLCDLLRKLKFVDQLCKNFVPPKPDEADEDDGEPEKGLPKYIINRRLRTAIGQMTETGRWTSRKPNL